MNKEGEMYVEETYDLLVTAMGVDPEESYETIEDMVQSIETREE